MKIKIILFISVFILVVTSGKEWEVSAYNESRIENQTKIVSISIDYLNEYERVETIIIEEYLTTKSNALIASLNTKTGTKTVNYYNGSTILWSVSVGGTFSYGNGTSTAQSVTLTTNSFDPNWKVEKIGSYVNGNSAIGTARGKRYLFGIVVQTVDREVILSCSSDGTLY